MRPAVVSAETTFMAEMPAGLPVRGPRFEAWLEEKGAEELGKCLARGEVGFGCDEIVASPRREKRGEG